MKQVDVAETLVEAADESGDDLTFDSHGKRVRKPKRPSKQRKTNSSE